MPDKETIYIQIIEEGGPLANDGWLTLQPRDFGGIIPEVGDFIAIPTLPDSDPRQNPRYLWPNTDPRTPMRVGLLVSEQNAQLKLPRKRSRRKATSPPATSTEDDIPFIIQQIYTCLNLAKEYNDSEVAMSLRRVAGAFADKAIALGASPETIPRGLSDITIKNKS